MAIVPPDAADRARTLFGDLVEGRSEENREQFSGKLRDHAYRIARAWAHMASSAGGFERAGQPSARQFGEYAVVKLPLAFKAGEGIGRVALDRGGKVAGLSVQYPRRRRLDPRPVRVFVHGLPAVTDLIMLGRPGRARRLPH
jgi:hypothetical protein